MNNLNEYEFNTELLNESYAYEMENMEGELAGQLMSVSNEYEFENFLGGIWDAAKKLYNSPQGQAIKKDFVSGARSLGKKMFPSIGKNIGGYFGGDKGAKYGGQIGSSLGKWILGDSEQEAVDYVRVLRKTANYLNKALSEGASGEPRTMVTQAINESVRPLLHKRRRYGYGRKSNNYSKSHGRWIRQGKQLIVLGVR